MSAKKPSKKMRYATIDNPTIQAVVHALYRFESRAEALAQLEALERHFIVSRKQLAGGQPSLHLWIKGYGLAEGDGARGVIGHFAVIGCKQQEGRWTLYATKLETPAETHPQRAQVKRDNPNWGHPVLRAVRKNKAYPSPEAAQSELDVLHRAFPRVSIPNPGKLYIMIYCASRPAKQRMVKHVLEIKALPDGGYTIDCKENTHRPALPKPSREAAPQGYFTAKVALRRSRRPKKPEA